MTGEKTPLTEIRSAELAAARAVSEATEAAEQAVADARLAAEAAVEHARAEGRAAADESYSRTVEKAQAEAAEIAAAIDDDVADVRRRVEPRIAALAELMLETLLPERSD